MEQLQTCQVLVQNIAMPATLPHSDALVGRPHTKTVRDSSATNSPLSTFPDQILGTDRIGVVAGGPVK